MYVVRLKWTDSSRLSLRSDAVRALVVEFIRRERKARSFSNIHYYEIGSSRYKRVKDESGKIDFE